MNQWLVLLLPLIFTLGTGQRTAEVISCGPEATCYGRNPCNACKTCNYCRHCNSGGTCGVCAPGKAKEKKTILRLPDETGQCKATTKKGTRCRNRAGYGNYCGVHSR